jgi:hypothetical protein
MTSLSVEQLTALTLTQCREIAVTHLRQHQRAGDKSITPHFAITVPVWWTKIQRSAMADVRWSQPLPADGISPRSVLFVSAWADICIAA